MQPQSQPLLWKAIAVACDPYFYSCVLLLGFEGVNGAISGPGFTDESPAAHGTGTVSGALAISTAQKQFGTSSASFADVPASTLSFPSSADWQFGSGPFTIEGWVRPNNDFNTGTIIGQWVGAGNQLSWLLYSSMNVAGGDQKLHWLVSTTGANILADIVGATSLVPDTWYAWALDFDGSKYRLYLNGVMDGSFSTPRILFAANAPLTLGSSNGGSNLSTEYQDEVRITKGIARYHSDAGYVPAGPFPRVACFVCATTWNPFDKAANVALSSSNRLATASAAGDMAVRANVPFSSGKHYFEITIGSTYTGGDTGIGISTAAANINNVGQTAVGAWLIYPSGNIYYNGSIQGIAVGALSAGDIVEGAVDLDNKRIWARKKHLGAVALWNGTPGADPATNTSGFDISSLFTSAAAFPTVSFGPSAAGTSMTANFGGSPFSDAPPAGFTGWCGSVANDPNFSNVVLLMGFEGANGSTSAPGMNDESSHAHGTGTANGNAQISTAQSKFGGSSFLDDGSSDYIQFATSNDWQLSAANSDQYTVECWVQPTTSTLDFRYLFWQSLGAPQFCWYFGFQASQLLFAASPDGTSNSSANPQSSGLTWTPGQWYFITADKDATGKIRLYRDGVMVASGTPLNSVIFNGVAGNVPLNIGGTPASSSFSFPGYIDEVRITKGVARYASDSGFTVPTAAFPRY